ncbi:MAG: methylmalonyl Co-A mutase-associated GTPase MeaB [Proteobacteria bacterium]|nr:methylmalonyl Co-A mutase-associated GTPase MeaB [Pseudomonadota bacterium]
MSPKSTKKRGTVIERRRSELSVEDHVRGVLERDRAVLARTITLVESNARDHQKTAEQVLKRLLPHTGKSVRVGITGVPGVGKSSFIDILGQRLLDKGKKVAVLAIDPSSSVTGGSILGDKTRMEGLARDRRCFIRPSPSSGALGGVGRKSRETMLVCEAAGFDVILVETVGVGQSEVTVRSMVDFFLLLMIPGAGDELQGIKRGVVELADALVVNKSDGDNKQRAELARGEYERALHYLLPATHGWQTRAYACSSITGEGVWEAWGVVEAFIENTTASGAFAERRKEQNFTWFRTLIEEHLKSNFFEHSDIAKQLPEIERSVIDGEMPVTQAVDLLMRAYKA